MFFWRVEVWTDSTPINYISKMVKVLGDYPKYNDAREAAKIFQYKEGRKTGVHCEIFKCGGVPLQHTVDNTKRHYLA